MLIRDHSNSGRSLLALVAALSLLTCLPRVPLQRLPTQTPIALATVVEPQSQGETTTAPPPLIQAVSESLAERNLVASEVPLEALGGQKLTEMRLDALKHHAFDAPLVLLIELRAHFFSQLDGRYRWEVGCTLTVSRKDGARAADSFELPVILVYDREREPEAIAQAAGEVASRVGRLLDGLLAQPAKPADVRRSPKAPLGIYFAMVDRFANGDRSNDRDIDLADPQAFHGGDLQGLIDRLDWIRSLGVDTLWLSPITAMRQTKWHSHGAFHGYWPYRFDALEPRFGDEATLAKLKAELERRGMGLVLDVVINHVGPDAPLVSERPDWFHPKLVIEDWADPQQLVNGRVHGLPDLDQENPEVLAHLVAATKGWLRRTGATGLRLDAVKHVPLSVWARFNAATGAPMLLGEMLDGDVSAVAHTWREGGFTHLFDFPLAFVATRVFCEGSTKGELAMALSNDRRYPDPSKLVTLLDNHDLPRLASKCGGDVEKMKNAWAFLLTARGIPSLAWGSEVGAMGEKEPANRADMVFDEAHPLKAHLSRLFTVRAGSPALSAGASVVLAATSEVVVLGRASPRQLGVVTVGKRDARPPLPAPWAEASWRRVELGADAVSLELADGAFSALASDAEKQWRQGARRIAVSITGPEGWSVVGSVPELGDWKPERALPLPATVELPVGSAFTFKRVRTTARGVEWAQGPDEFRFVM